MRLRASLGRAILVVGSLATVLVFSGPPLAGAADGDTVIAGQSNAEDHVPVFCQGPISCGTDTVTALRGVSDVDGGVGVSAQSYGNSGTGLSAAGPSTGITASGGTVGLDVTSANGTGVHTHVSNASSAIYAENAGTGNAVSGQAVSGTAVLGDSVGAGVGVSASSAGGIALKVAGRAQLSTSGVASVAGTSAAPRNSVRVYVGLTAKSVITATMQKYVAGVYVVATVPNLSGGYFTLYLNKAVTTSVGPIAWMVVEHP